MNDLKQTGISDAYKNGTRITLVEQPPFVGLIKPLDIDKGEWLEDIERGESSSASFLACVEVCISERESRRFELRVGLYRNPALSHCEPLI